MSKLKILYVEDYPVVQLLYTDILKTHFDVDVVSDGKEALEKVKDHEYDIILLDLLLPRLGGIEFLELYREEHKDAAKPRMIVLTDFDNPETVKRTKELGVHDYWMKVNTTPYALVDKIKALKKA